MRSRLFRRPLTAAVASVVTVLLLLSVAELAVRWLMPQEHMPQDIYALDSALGFRMVPNYRGNYVGRDFSMPLATNSWGLRDRDYGPRSEGGVRIYALGDSFLFGYRVPIEQTFTKLLEHALQRRLGSRPVEVVNGGVPGYGTLQLLKFFEETADVVQPDLVLVGMSAANDIWDNQVFDQRPATPGIVRRLRSRVSLALKQSELYLMLRRYYNAAARRDRLPQARARASDARVEQALTLTEGALHDLARAAARHGSGFVVVLIPVREEVYPARAQQRISARVAAFARREGIALLDLRPHLATHPREQIYFTVHWTPYGHALAAKVTADFLLAMGLLEPGSDVSARAVERREAH